MTQFVEYVWHEQGENAGETHDRMPAAHPWPEQHDGDQDQDR